MPKREDAKPCTMQGKTIRCECGGQVSVGGTLHPLTDFGVGFRNGKFVVDKSYNMKRVVGYTGLCMSCRYEGQFVLTPAS